MNTQTPIQNESSKFYRFQLFLGASGDGGKVKKTKSVGMAYLKEGQNIYTLRLWMFLLERYYLLQNQNDPAKYFIMTREPNKNPAARNKYFWNIVGNGEADTKQGLIILRFDLLAEPLYLNIYPEASALSASLAAPEDIPDVA
jgi:hypothetical protein